jgi:hypothetical protein
MTDFCYDSDGVIRHDFSFVIGDDQTLTFETDKMSELDLENSTIFWNVYAMSFGVPIPNIAAVISKTSESEGGVTPIGSPESFEVDMLRADTVDLAPGNYYHEGTVVNNSTNDFTTVIRGTVTLTNTLNRPEA